MLNSRKINMLVAGVARNCQRTLKDDIKRLVSALSFVEEVHWLIIESDSTDSTVECL